MYLRAEQRDRWLQKHYFSQHLSFRQKQTKMSFKIWDWNIFVLKKCIPVLDFWAGGGSSEYVSSFSEALRHHIYYRSGVFYLEPYLYAAWPT